MNGCDNNFSVPAESGVVKREPMRLLSIQIICMDLVRGNSPENFAFASLDEGNERQYRSAELIWSQWSNCRCNWLQFNRIVDLYWQNIDTCVRFERNDYIISDNRIWKYGCINNHFNCHLYLCVETESNMTRALQMWRQMNSWNAFRLNFRTNYSIYFEWFFAWPIPVNNANASLSIHKVKAIIACIRHLAR